MVLGLEVYRLKNKYSTNAFFINQISYDSNLRNKISPPFPRQLIPEKEVDLWCGFVERYYSKRPVSVNEVIHHKQQLNVFPENSHLIFWRVKCTN